MTVTTTNQDDSRAEELLRLAEEQCAEMLEDLAACAEYYKGPPDHELPEAELKRVLTNMRRSMVALFEERGRLDDMRKRRAGIVHDYAIDFDEARSEIGRRLARLRDATGAGGVPE